MAYQTQLPITNARRVGGSGVRITGVDKVMRKLEGIARISAERYAQMGNIGVSGIKTNFEGNKLGWPDISENTKFQKKSSQILVDSTELKNSIFWRKTATGLELFTRSAKAAWMQFGTRPHEIWARFSANRFVGGKRQPMLSFDTPTGRVFRRMVKHPGTVPRPFMVLRKEVLQQMVDVLRRALRETK